MPVSPTVACLNALSIVCIPSRTNMKLHISVTPKMTKKVITNFDSPKASGPVCIIVKN